VRSHCLHPCRHCLRRKISRFEDAAVAETFLSPSGKSGTALAYLVQALAVTASLCLQFGSPLEVLTRALPKLEDGSAADPSGALLDRIEKDSDTRR
jgi:L-lysine 2,3-aminomutase